MLRIYIPCEECTMLRIYIPCEECMILYIASGVHYIYRLMSLAGIALLIAVCSDTQTHPNSTIDYISVKTDIIIQ